MIEINLIPDVKYQLLKARRLRTTIISASIIAVITSVGIVVLLAVYVFGVQSLASWSSDNAIKDEFKKLSSVKDLSKTLTIQNQLSQLSNVESDKLRTSRLFDMLATIIPTDKNKVSISSLKLDSKEGTVTLEAEAVNGYEALEVFKKTIAQTKFKYVQGSENQDSVDLASDISDGDRNYGQNARGERVLRFTLSFIYAKELFDSSSSDGTILAPSKQIATDSATGVPISLFTDHAKENE